MENTILATNGAYYESLRASENTKDIYVFGEEMYSAGMVYVIREMASIQFQACGYKNTSEVEEEFRRARKLYNELFQTLDEEHKAMLREMFDKLESFGTNSEERGFIEGYVRGYRFVKELG